MAEEEKAEEENKPDFKEGEFDEHTSYSFLFFLIAGATLFVTLWAFWDDEYALSLIHISEPTRPY